MYRILIFLSLMATWLILSGQFDAFHIGLGVISSLLVTILSGDMMYIRRHRAMGARVGEAFRIVGYLFWLLWEMTVFG